jgi:hypothetical protein
LKQPRHIRRRGASTAVLSSDPTKHQPPGKIKNKKGASEISLETFFINGVFDLLASALDKNSPTRERAGELLAFVDAVIAENRKKLCKENKGYRQQREKFGKPLRSVVWFPESPLYQALHCELQHCWFHRGELPAPLFRPKWGKEEFQSLMKVSPLSLKSFPRWENKLWPLFKKHNSALLPKLRLTAKRQQIVPVHSDGVTKYLPKPLKLTWKLLRPQFRRHLKLIASRNG